MVRQPLPSERIKTPPTDIGIEETRGQSRRREAARRADARRASRIRRLLAKVIPSHAAR